MCRNNPSTRTVRALAAIALLWMNLFTYRDFWAWLDQPFEGPPELPDSFQEALALG